MDNDNYGLTYFVPFPRLSITVAENSKFS